MVQSWIRGWIWGLALAVVAAGFAWGWTAQGQMRGERVPAASVGGELRGLASRADVVFVGQVEKIENQGGVVQITFAVEQPVLGAVGGTYGMREWAGRWTGGQRRYFVGERAMFFLHAPKVAADGSVGLSSPVDGMMGVVPVVPMGANGKALLDVRWLAARMRRSVGTPLVDADAGAMALEDAVTVARGWRTETAEPKSVRLPAGWRVGDAAEADGAVAGGQKLNGRGLRDARR
ncbi:MAG: hypothetical protein WBY53_16725 [Acidobacteriaceae bacterium]